MHHERTAKKKQLMEKYSRAGQNGALIGLFSLWATRYHQLKPTKLTI